MNNVLNQFVDESWDRKEFDLPSGSQSVFVKRNRTLVDAKRIRNAYFQDVYSAGGAIFLGESPRLTPISPQEMMRLTELGLDPPEREPFYIELIAIERIDFQHVSEFIDFYNYGETKGAAAKNIRKEAKELLHWICGVEPICFSSINFSSIGLKFLGKTSLKNFNLIFEKVIGFNSGHFSMELSRKIWRQTFRSSNGFSLGPG